MSLITIDEFKEFAVVHPELADTVRSVYPEDLCFDEEWNSFVDSMMSQDTTYGGNAAASLSTVVY